MNRLVLGSIGVVGLLFSLDKAPAQDKFAEINKAELEKCLAELPAGIRHEHVIMPLRDGVKLATDVFRPAQGDGPWPVMLLRTPYSRLDPWPVQEMDKESCVLVVQKQRGRYESESTPPKDSFANEVEDSYDAIDWPRQTTIPFDLEARQTLIAKQGADNKVFFLAYAGWYALFSDGAVDAFEALAPNGRSRKRHRV